MPSLYPDLVEYWDAFQFLSGSRPIGMAAGMIPLSEIRGYLDEVGIENYEERFEWIRWIQFIDSEFMAEDKKSKEKGPAQPAQKPHPKPKGKR